MTQATIKTQLNEIRDLLLPLHKELLHHQKASLEEKEGRFFSLHETLQMTISHPDFQWLRTLSALILAIDEAVDDKESPPLDPTLVTVVTELRAILGPKSSTPHLVQELQRATQKNPHLGHLVSRMKRLIDL